MDCYEAARMLKVAPSTIRSWSRKGWITRVNPGDEGRALYESVDILRHAKENPPQRRLSPTRAARVRLDDPLVCQDIIRAAQVRAARRKDGPVGYDGVHHRIRKQRGKAEDHPCFYCGSSAAEWAYDHTDPDALIDPRGFAYSLDIGRYHPLCRSCHGYLDRQYAHVGRGKVADRAVLR